MKIAAISFLCILLAGVVEYALHAKALKKIPIRILVNGTRGKTSVTRLMAAVMRNAGYVTYAKSTGSEAVLIGPDNVETPIRRRRGVRLTEQLPFVRVASTGHADAIVVECMAIQPESQYVMATRLIKPTITLLTNARVDHVAEMGNTTEETLRALSFSITKDTTVISTEPMVEKYTKNLYWNDDITFDESYMQKFQFSVFKENVRLVLAAAAFLNIPSDTALVGMTKAKPDIGMAGPFLINNNVVINAFAANDVKSTLLLLSKTEKEYDMENTPIRIIYNNRADREYRLKQFLPLVTSLSARCVSIYLLGDNKAKIQQFFRKRTSIGHVQAGLADNGKGLNTDADLYKEMFSQRGIILCIGNIKGEGASFIRCCIAVKENNNAE